MRKNNVTAIISALMICMTGCAKNIDEAPVEQNETAASESSETLAAEETESETSAEEVISEEESEEKLPGSEEFFAIFDGADPVSGRIADTMEEAAESVNDEYTVEQLSAESISSAIESDTLSTTLFRFTMNGNSGILPSDSRDGGYFACKYTSEDGGEYAVVLGSSSDTTYREADRYISACGTADYLALCSENDGQVILMPIAAGNSDCGIYGVVPAAEYMGYDMSETDSFEGIPESFSIRITGVSESDENTTVYCKMEQRFSEAVYFSCEKIFLNGENITGNLTAETAEQLEENGSFIFSDCPMKDGDALYFYGKICRSEDGGELYEAGTAAVINSVESLDDDEASVSEEETAD